MEAWHPGNPIVRWDTPPDLDPEDFRTTAARLAELADRAAARAGQRASRLAAVVAGARPPGLTPNRPPRPHVQMVAACRVRPTNWRPMTGRRLHKAGASAMAPRPLAGADPTHAEAIRRRLRGRSSDDVRDPHPSTGGTT
jgi:hypothetical protein